MKKNTKLTIVFGVICAVLTGVSSWYTIVYNEARWIVPMDLSEYVFRKQDLPMLISGGFLAVYILYLAGLFLRVVFANNRRAGTAQSTRTISPKLGFFGLFGFVGFLGFWTYSVHQVVFPFISFIFFGFFGFFYEGKMSDTLMDERYRENRIKAQATADKTALAIIFLALIILGQGRLIGNLEYTLIAFIIVTALAMALAIFLSEYLLYRYDHDEQFDESGE